MASPLFHWLLIVLLGAGFAVSEALAHSKKFGANSVVQFLDQASKGAWQAVLAQQSPLVRNAAQIAESAVEQGIEAVLDKEANNVRPGANETLGLETR